MMNSYCNQSPTANKQIKSEMTELLKKHFHKKRVQMSCKHTLIHREKKNI